MKKDNLTKRIWNPHNQSDSMFQMRVFLGAYKLLQVGCIYSRQKVMQWKKLQPHCSCASANQSAPHWLPLSDNSQAANQRMKYSHLMEWSLTHPASNEEILLTLFSIIIRISPVSPPWWSQALLTLKNAPIQIYLIHSFISMLKPNIFFKCIWACTAGHFNFNKYIFPPSFYL